MDDPAPLPIALLNCCANEMEKYCLENNIPSKILFILDDAPTHPPFIGDQSGVSPSKHHLVDQTNGSRSYSSF